MTFEALPALLVGSVSALGVTVLLMKRSILTEKASAPGPAHRPRIQR